MFSTLVFANQADVVNATASYEILDSNNVVLGKRMLHHPHVNEQPFTRSLSNVKIPKDVNVVYVRANDLVHGLGDKVFKLKLY